MDVSQRVTDDSTHRAPRGPTRRRAAGRVVALAALVVALVGCAVFGPDGTAWPPQGAAALPTTILVTPGVPEDAPGYDWSAPSEDKTVMGRSKSLSSMVFVNAVREEFASSGLFSRVRAGEHEPDATRVELWYRTETTTPSWDYPAALLTLFIFPAITVSHLQLAFRVVSPDGRTLGAFELRAEETQLFGWLMLFAMPFGTDSTLQKHLGRVAATRVAEILASPSEPESDDDVWRGIESEVPWIDDR